MFAVVVNRANFVAVGAVPDGSFGVVFYEQMHGFFFDVELYVCHAPGGGKAKNLAVKFGVLHDAEL